MRTEQHKQYKCITQPTTIIDVQYGSEKNCSPKRKGANIYPFLQQQQKSMPFKKHPRCVEIFVAKGEYLLPHINIIFTLFLLLGLQSHSILL